jgi:hypothetical protein
MLKSEGGGSVKNLPGNTKHQDHSVRRLPGSADDRLGDGGNSRGSHRFVFGTRREHKLNLLCGLFGVSDSKWMSGSAESGNQKPRGNVVQRQILIKPIARSPKRAGKSCAFLLTMTYMDARYLEATRIISHTPTCLAKAGQLHASGY